MTKLVIGWLLVSRAVLAASSPGPAASLGTFTFALYREARTSDGNLLISPFSVHAALAMVLAGAKGRTAETLRQALELPAGKDPLTGYGAWSGGYATRAGGPYELRVANALWGEKTVPFLAPFTERLQTEFHAPLEAVDFRNAAEAARITINAWALEKTGGKIDNLVPPGLVSSETRLVLANAIYLKALWERPFQKELTSPEMFYIEGKRAEKVPTMHQWETMPYLDTSVLQMVELPYKNGELAMVIVLPRRKDGLAALENRLTYEAFKGWLAKMESKSLRLTVPKFTFASDLRLSRALSGLGLKGLFRSDADFKGMTTAVPLKISEVIHKAFIDVNETGTEAAAATAVAMKAGAALVEPVSFVADHPFLFVIYDRRDGGILFVGRLTRPSA